MAIKPRNSIDAGTGTGAPHAPVVHRARRGRRWRGSGLALAEYSADWTDEIPGPLRRVLGFNEKRGAERALQRQASGPHLSRFRHRQD